MSVKIVLSGNIQNKEEIKEPRLYKVVLHNDDYTPMEFVIDILIEIFNKSQKDAHEIMLHVHEKGKGEGGIYPYDIGLTKIQEVKRRAIEGKYPLLCTLERV